MLQAYAGSAMISCCMQKKRNSAFFYSVLESEKERLGQYRLEDMRLHTLLDNTIEH
jgi:hypothetical protein